MRLFLLLVATAATVAFVRPDYIPYAETVGAYVPAGLLDPVVEARATAVSYVPRRPWIRAVDWGRVNDTIANYVELPGALVFDEAPARPLDGLLLPGATDAQVAAARADFEAHLAVRERHFLEIPRLGGVDKRKLKRSRNDRHVEHARRLGVKHGHDTEALLAGGALVKMPDSTAHYVVRNNAGLLAPDAIAAIELVQGRFTAALAGRGLPPLRLTVSSTYRSPEDQRQLRRRNRNATSGVSAHEFGTTFDLAYQRYAPAAAGVSDPETYVMPADLPLRERTWLAAEFAERERTWAAEVANHYPSRMQALLGRVLIQLEDERKLAVVREWRQPCFHVTIAQRFTASGV